MNSCIFLCLCITAAAKHFQTHMFHNVSYCFMIFMKPQEIAMEREGEREALHVFNMFLYSLRHMQTHGFACNTLASHANVRIQYSHMPSAGCSWLGIAKVCHGDKQVLSEKQTQASISGEGLLPICGMHACMHAVQYILLHTYIQLHTYSHILTVTYIQLHTYSYILTVIVELRTPATPVGVGGGKERGGCHLNLRTWHAEGRRPILGLCWPSLGLCWPILRLCWPMPMRTKCCNLQHFALWDGKNPCKYNSFSPRKWLKHSYLQSFVHITIFDFLKNV